MKLARVAVMALAPGLVAGSQPVTKIIKMLESLKGAVEKEKETAYQTYVKFKCWCNDGASGSKDAIKKAETEAKTQSDKKNQAASAAKAAKAALAAAKSERKTAKADLQSATETRKADATKFRKENEEVMANLDAMVLAMEALGKGMGQPIKVKRNAGEANVFLQQKTDALSVVRKIVQQYGALINFDADQNEHLASFLQGVNDAGYGSQSGEIMGMMKQLYETMKKNAGEALSEEESAQASFDEQKSLLNQTIANASNVIEKKIAAVGNQEAARIQAKALATAAAKEAADEKKRLAGMEEECANTETEYDQAVKTRNEELAAIADTIQYLNSSAVRELMRKATVADDSFLQTSAVLAGKSVRAAAALSSVKSKSPALAFVLRSLKTQSKTDGKFFKVCELISGMLEVLKSDHENDRAQKDTCTKFKNDQTLLISKAENRLDTYTKNKNAADASIADLTAKIEDKEGDKATLEGEVEKATALRNEQAAEFNENMSNNNVAISIIKTAINRMAKFYNKAKYTAPETKTPTAGQKQALEQAKENGDQATVDKIMLELAVDSGAPQMGLVDLVQKPKVEMGASKSGQGNNIINMMEMLITDIEKDNLEMTTDEKAQQKAYAQFSEESAASLEELSNAIAAATAAKNSADSDKVDAESKMATTTTELEGLTTGQKENAEACDFLWKNFDLRKAMRTDEENGLRSAHGILACRNESEEQTKSVGDLGF